MKIFEKILRLMFLKKVRVRSFEVGVYFRDREFVGLLDAGRHWFFDPLGKVRVDVHSRRETWFLHDELEAIVKSGALGDRALVVDLKDHERALVWINGRFDQILQPAVYALWKDPNDVRVEIVDAREVRFTHKEERTIARWNGADHLLSASTVENGYKALYFLDGRYVDTLGPGQYLFWRGAGKVRVQHVDMRECLLDISGQDIMTGDKVTLRMNAVVTYRVRDAVKAVCEVDDHKQALYREAQLALRAVVGAFELDELLSGKEKVAADLKAAVSQKAMAFGIGIVGLGIRDVILPGEMKDLMNKVIEARKAADANLIMRREETAAMRSQANTAKLLDSNPTLMRLRELDVLEKIARDGKLNVVVGEKGLADRIVNLL